MQNLYRNFRLQLELTSTDFIRFLHDQIAWDSRLIACRFKRMLARLRYCFNTSKSTRILKKCFMLPLMTFILPIIGFSI